jgi:hypothetical protein
MKKKGRIRKTIRKNEINEKGRIRKTLLMHTSIVSSKHNFISNKNFP